MRFFRSSLTHACQERTLQPVDDLPRRNGTIKPPTHRRLQTTNKHVSVYRLSSLSPDTTYTLTPTQPNNLIPSNPIKPNNIKVLSAD